MLLTLVATSWLLSTGLCAPHSYPYANVIDDREAYWNHARSNGMCNKYGREENLNRALVVPGNKVLSSFSDCVAKNEFGESLTDTTGQIFCYGPLIHLMADAQNHEDSKSFVDQATTLSGVEINRRLSSQIASIRDTGLNVTDFLNRVKEFGFSAPGQELQDYENSRFPNTPDFVHLIRLQARLFRAWSKIVHHYWHNLDRNMTQMHGDYLLPGPGSVLEETREKYSTSLIRLDHPFVVAGGRFREQYYWDSFFIMEGLLAANVTYLARTMLLNFMDEIKAYGFIPNGGRKYYLNRSQPPLFISRELRWWYNNRSVLVSHNGAEHRVFRYNVHAKGPRPESYAEDWRSAWCHSEHVPTKIEEEELYSQFASGAETGWDYTARWMSEDFDKAGNETGKQMRHLRVSDVIPVDLNSILYRSHKLMAHMYNISSTNESPFAAEYSRRHDEKARSLNDAILALHWDSDNLSFFDFVLKRGENEIKRTGSIHRFWSGASMVPYWAGIWPTEFSDCSSSETKRAVMQAFAGIRDILNMYPGPLPSTLVQTGQQWDFPNSWPPLQYFAIQALENVRDTCIDQTTTESFKSLTRPKQSLGDRPHAPASKNATNIDYSTSPSWRDVLTKTVVMRYMNAAYCTWNEEGKIPSDRVEIVVRDNPRLDPTLAKHPGNMYEKLNALSATKAGTGGEYHVQTGFGWTNGVALWIAKNYGAILDNPSCGNSTTSPPSKSPGVDVEWEESIIFQK
ncbi:trehalase [Ceratobasidium sp. AG-Ba]|nr:trehalase [Ceratobasidium sp. AG-Ba]